MYMLMQPLGLFQISRSRWGILCSLNAAMLASANLLELSRLVDLQEATDFEFYFEVTDFGYDVVKLSMMTRNLWILVLEVELSNTLHGAEREDCASWSLRACDEHTGLVPVLMAPSNLAKERGTRTPCLAPTAPS